MCGECNFSTPVLILGPLDRLKSTYHNAEESAEFEEALAYRESFCRCLGHTIDLLSNEPRLREALIEWIRSYWAQRDEETKEKGTFYG